VMKLLESVTISAGAYTFPIYKNMVVAIDAHS